MSAAKRTEAGMLAPELTATDRPAAVLTEAGMLATELPATGLFSLMVSGAGVGGHGAT